MSKFNDLAELIFPEITETIEDLEKRFPKRNLKEGAEVTRFAPSPTGFLHTGSLFTAMVSKNAASHTDGIFYVRLEDTDTKREIKGSSLELLEQLKFFDVFPNEGFMGDHEEGEYGPYRQSERANIYKIVIKDLIKRDLAYPCFCTPEELDETRKVQEEFKQIPGYYGQYAKCRFLSVDEQIELIKAGKPYVIRFKSQGNHNNKIRVHDEIRGTIDIAQNDLDTVILKSDGLPTYHFAHVCDDHFMHTTLVTRGEEWISSLPIHIEMFNLIGWTAPKYAHLPLIMKLENGNKRKLSKRKDPEAAVSFFDEQGFPSYATLIYLMSIANSNFEEWTRDNQNYSIDAFPFSVSKMSLDGALFDMDKLSYFSKEYLSRLTADEMVNNSLEWAKRHNKELENLILSDINYYTQIMSIERNKEKPRKDYAKYSDILPVISFFYKDKFASLIKDGYTFNETFEKTLIKDILTTFKANLDLSKTEEEWFNGLKEIATNNGFAMNNKEFKKNPGVYKGHVGDVAEMVRIALTGRKNSPNLYCVIQTLGLDEVNSRLDFAINYLG